MRKIRWILFLPAAFLASLIAGAVGNYATSIVSHSAWFVWAVSGAFSGAAFLWAGSKVSPSSRPSFTKWSLVSVLAVLGAMSLAGGLLVGTDIGSGWAGAVMVVAALAAARVPADGFNEVETIAQYVPPLALSLWLSWELFVRSAVMPFYRWYAQDWAAAGGWLTHAWMVFVMGMTAIFLVGAPIEAIIKGRDSEEE